MQLQPTGHRASPPAIRVLTLRAMRWTATATVCFPIPDRAAKCDRVVQRCARLTPVSAQPAPAAVAYCSLFDESCYDAMDEVQFSFTETIYHGDCPGITPLIGTVITDCNGLQNAILQTITVVDNLPPVILTDLTPDTLDCNDPVFFSPLQAEDACGGN